MTDPHDSPAIPQPSSDAGDGKGALWDREPDAHDFVDDATGYRCALRRNGGGAWCGYIEVPANHPWHGLDYNAEVVGTVSDEATVDELGIISVFCHALVDAADTVCLGMLVRAHGGLTYAGYPWWDKSDKNSWWFGFDCSHSGDLSPKYIDRDRRFGWHTGDVYRDMPYVIEVCKKAAGDLHAACTPATPPDSPGPASNADETKER